MSGYAVSGSTMADGLMQRRMLSRRREGVKTERTPRAGQKESARGSN
jgi:hypothetical protein